MASSTATHIRPMLFATNCQVHAEHHDLVHGMIKTQIAWSDSAYFQLVGDIAGTEHACGEGNERIEHDKYDVQVVDLQIGTRLGPAKSNITAASKGQKLARRSVGMR